MFGPPIDTIREEQGEVAPTERAERFSVPTRATGRCGKLCAARYKYFSSPLALRWQGLIPRMWLFSHNPLLLTEFSIDEMERLANAVGLRSIPSHRLGFRFRLD